MGNKIEKYIMDKKGKEGYSFWCPGCEQYHGVIVKSPTSPLWSFNNSLTHPTFKPSILVRSVSTPKFIEKDKKGEYILGPDGRLKGAKDIVCHSYITDGKINFLGDCTHALKGQTVDLVDFF